MFEGMKFGMIIAADVRFDQARAWWRDVEALGFDAVGVADTPLLMRDAFVSLAAIAMETSRIDLMMTVTNTLTRDISVMAGSMLALEELAPGRMTFGFGSGDSATYGTGLGRASFAQMEDYLRALRGLTAGEEVVHQGRKLHAAWADWQPWSPRIMVAASGPRALEMAGRTGDVVIGGLGFTPECLERSDELIRKGARDAGRDPDEVEHWHLLTVSPGATVEEGFVHAGMGGAVGVARSGFEGKLYPEEYRDALIEMGQLWSLDTHARANTAALEVARKTPGLIDYLVQRSGGMSGPVDYTEVVQGLERAGVRNIMFVALGPDKPAVVRGLSEAVVTRRGAGSPDAVKAAG